MTHPTPPTDPVDGIRKALAEIAVVDSGFDLHNAKAAFHEAATVDAIRELLDRLDSAERALRNVKRVIGPCVPECSGCYEEWSEALRIIDAAIDEQLRSVGEKESK